MARAGIIASMELSAPTTTMFVQRPSTNIVRAIKKSTGASLLFSSSYALFSLLMYVPAAVCALVCMQFLLLHGIQLHLPMPRTRSPSRGVELCA
eukprot:scaffold315709_cov18-Prasinocladus_malaysianus.AAC.1